MKMKQVREKTLDQFAKWKEDRRIVSDDDLAIYTRRIAKQLDIPEGQFHVNKNKIY